MSSADHPLDRDRLATQDEPPIAREPGRRGAAPSVRARAAVVAAVVALSVSCGQEGITINTPECVPVDLTYPGSVNGTMTAGSTCQSGGFYAALYRFTADGDSATRFNATSGFPVIGLEVMTDPPGNNAVWTGGSAGISATWLLPTGTYLLRVTARNGTGSFALTGSNAPPNTTVCAIRTLVVGVTLFNRELAATDCPYLDNTGDPDGTYFDAYVIQSTQPCTISMESATMDSYLEIRDAQGTRLGGNDEVPGSGTPHAFLSLTACNNGGGPIVIRANTATSAVPTGEYTLAVELGGGGAIVAGNQRR